MAVTRSLCVTQDPVSTLSSGSYNEEDHLGLVTLGGGAGPPWGMGNQVPTQFWLMPKPPSLPSRTCPTSVITMPPSTSASKGMPCLWVAMRPTPSFGRR